MIIEELDTFIRQLTSSEIRYKNGYKNHSWDVYKQIETEDGILLEITEPEVFSSTLHDKAILDVKKHSRFQDCPMHFHNFIEINYMYSGKCTQIINGKYYYLKKGQILLIDSETVHTIKRLGEDDILINFFVKKDLFNQYFFNRQSTSNIIVNFFINSIIENTAHNNFIFFYSENSRRLSLFANELLYEYYFPSTNSLELINNLFSLLMSELVNIREKDIYSDTSLDKNSSFIEILKYIEKHYSECTLQNVADKFNFNPTYLSDQIKKNTGYSFKELIHSKKFQKAEFLLSTTSFSIEKIAKQVGYSNLSFFYKKFKAIYGCTPRDYRLKVNSTVF